MKTHYETRWRGGVATRYLVVNCGDYKEPKKSVKLNTYYPLNKIYEFLREGQVVATNGDAHHPKTDKFFTGKIKKVTIDGSDVDILIERHDGKYQSLTEDGLCWLVCLCADDEKVHGKDSTILLSILDNE